jgi:hypothetical protein
MFIVAKRGIRLRKSFWVWSIILWMFILAPAALLTMHIHYDPEPKRRKLAVG